VNFEDLLAQLRGERLRIDAAITALENLDLERPREPGRPARLVTKSSTVKSEPNGINRSAVLPSEQST
jgi:hypothetical protein